MAKDWTHIYKNKSYKGKWVALEHDERTIAGSGASLEEAIATAQKNGCPDPIVMSVPERVISFGG